MAANRPSSTPKERVLARHPRATCHNRGWDKKRLIQWWQVWDHVDGDGGLLGMGRSASAAWKNAARNDAARKLEQPKLATRSPYDLAGEKEYPGE